MSNYLAIATVTKALHELMSEAARAAVSGADASTKRPAAITDTDAAQPRINVYLYHVTANPHLSNHDLPTRRADGTVVTRPQLALNLNYLLSFYGDESKWEPERLLGMAISQLHAKPQLSRAEVRRISTGAVSGSNLADQVDLVKFTPLGLTLEEVSKLWSVFFQTTYILSVAYCASVVLLSGDEISEMAKPVATPVVWVNASPHRPTIPAVQPDALQGIQLWLRADAGIDYNNVALVAQWDDQSGNQHHARQGDDAAKPVLVRNLWNRRPIVRFDGTDDFLVLDQLKYAAAGAVGGMTLFAVVSSSSSDRQVLVSFDADHYWSVTLNGDKLGVGWHTHSPAIALSQSQFTQKHYADWGLHLLCVWYSANDPEDKRIFVDGQQVLNPGEMRFFTNNAASDPPPPPPGQPVVAVNAHGGANLGTGATRYGFVGVASQASDATADQVRQDLDAAHAATTAGDLVEAAARNKAAWATWAAAIGPRTFFKGDLAELLLYDRALSNHERQQIEQYFIKRYISPR